MHNDCAKSIKKIQKRTIFSKYCAFLYKIGDGMSKTNVIVRMDYKLSINSIDRKKERFVGEGYLFRQFRNH